MLKRVDIVGNPNVGIFILTTDDLAIVPYNILDEKIDIIKEALDVDIIKSSVAGSNLVGSLTVANSNGIILPQLVFEREVEYFKDMGLNVAILPDKYTALGNIIAANDNGAIVSPYLSSESIKTIEKTLDVNVESTAICGSDIIGSLITVTNKGFLVSKNASEDEVNLARDIFNVEGDIGTVGHGNHLVGACTISNSNGAIVAKESTGPEMARVEEALGFLDDL